MKKTILTLFLLAMISGMQAQRVAIENVIKPYKSDFGAIKQGTEVKGYYFFWISDKLDKNSYEYTLRITDNTLKTLKDVKMEGSKEISVLESAFNGTDLIFLFYNNKENTFDYQVYGADGKKKYSYNRQLTKKEDRFLRNTYLAMDDDEGNYKGLYAVEGQGFVSNTPSREDKDYTFQIDYFSTEKRKQWSYTPTNGGKKLIGDYLGTFNGVVFFEELKFGGAFDQNPDSYILGLSQETGKVLFENSTDDHKYKYYPASMSYVNGKTYVFGEYFDPNGNVMKDKSRGYAFWGIDEKGKILSEKYLSWDVDMAKYLDVSSKGKIDNLGYMYLHQMVQLKDGNVYAIGEGFKKTASALGIAANLLSRNSNISVAKITVTDMILLKFDKDFNIKGATIYDKTNNRIEFPSGYEFTSPPLMGKLVKYAIGGFDYAYTQLNSNSTAFSAFYSDFVRGKDYKGATFNSISCRDGKITQDHIQTKSDANHAFVLPSAEGSVLILEIWRKDKRIEGHIEKMN